MRGRPQWAQIPRPSGRGAVSKVRKQDGTVVLIPNSSVIGNKIYLMLQKLTGQQSGQ